MQSINNTGEFFWGTKYLPGIRPYLPNNVVDILAINTAIVFFNKTVQKDLNAIQIKITSSGINQQFYKIKYTVEKQLDVKSYFIKDALKKYLNKKTVLELPFCAAVDEVKFNNSLIFSSLASQIE